MKFHNKFYFIAPFVLFVFITSCKKMVEIDPPKNQVVTSAVFTDSINATSAVMGIYINLMNVSSNLFIGNGGITLYTGLSSDELNTTGNDPSEIDFYTNSISKQNDNNKNLLWKKAYEIIYQCNASIEGLANSTGISSTLRSQLTGEVKFVRAFIFFNLVNLYGDVPLVTTTEYHINATLPRAAKNSIYQTIVTDLTDALQLLSSNYVSSGRVRPNKQTATALLARVYLYQGQWANAEDAATQIISSPTYSLVTDLNTVFLAVSNEAIWQSPPLQNGYATAEGSRFIPPSATVFPSNPISNYLLNAFEIGDNRKVKWLNSNIVSGQTYYYPYKYKLRLAGSPTENYMIFRLAEQYLIRAETRAQQNNLSGAISDLNVIRNRAGLSNTMAITQAELLLAIEHERQTELFCEWGHRWYDLKRTNRADAVLGVEKAPDWQPTDALFPIPFAEMQLNPFLTQNPGY